MKISPPKMIIHRTSVPFTHAASTLTHGLGLWCIPLWRTTVGLAYNHCRSMVISTHTGSQYESHMVYFE